MKTKIIKATVFTLLITGIFSSCKKEKNNPDLADSEKELKTYSLSNIENAAFQNAKCGIDLANGQMYSIADGAVRQENIDIAYGYMMRPERYERCFLAISYAGCFCGGASYFSYGDQIGYDGINYKGYSSYSVKNETKLLVATADVNFDKIFSEGKKSDMDAVFPDFQTGRSNDEAVISSNDNLIQHPYIFFKTVKGKRGIMRIKGYVKNTSADYQLQRNPITIDVVVEK